MKKAILVVASLYTLSSYPSTDKLVRFGDYTQVASPIIAAGYSLYKKDTEGLSQLTLSYSTNQVLTHGMKSIIDAKRPNGGAKSFPSGHTSSSFGGATYLHYRYGFKAAAPIYLAATIAGYSRVKGRYHYVHDVAAGALLAAFSSYIFVDKKSNINLSPVLTPDGKSKGLMFGIEF